MGVRRKGSKWRRNKLLEILSNFGETTKQSIGVKMIVQKSSVKLGPELKILNEDIVVSKQKDAGTERQ